MKFELEVVMFNVADVVTASGDGGYDPSQCTTFDLPDA